MFAALALVFAQVGAMSHAYAHDTAAHAASPAADKWVASSHASCSECVAYAPLLCAAGAPAATLIVDTQSRSTAACLLARSRADLGLTLAFRSRAPPQPF